jgi:hypothetical protein
MCFYLLSVPIAQLICEVQIGGPWRRQVSALPRSLALHLSRSISRGLCVCVRLCVYGSVLVPGLLLLVHGGTTNNRIMADRTTAGRACVCSRASPAAR